MLFWLSSRSEFNFFILFYGVLFGQNTWVPVISQVKKKFKVDGREAEKDCQR
jgi:hypothetical protein